MGIWMWINNETKNEIMRAIDAIKLGQAAGVSEVMTRDAGAMAPPTSGPMAQIWAYAHPSFQTVTTFFNQPCASNVIFQQCSFVLPGMN